VALFFWDASALAKRYTEELGSDVVDALFAAVLRADMATTVWGYTETYAVLTRRLNADVIDLASFEEAVSLLEREIILDADFHILEVADATVLSGLSLIRAHNLNATDAALLAMLLEFVADPAAPAPCVLISADQRFLRAAVAEGLTTLNPEQTATADIPAWLAALGS